MSTRRRLTAAFSAFALGWVGLAALVVAGPAAQAEAGNACPARPGDVLRRDRGALRHAAGDDAQRDHRRQHLASVHPGATDVWDALKVTDRDPNNANRIIDAYSGDSL